MSTTPTPEQTLLLWTLLGAGGQGKLSEGKDREALLGAGLVAAGWRAGSKTPLFEVTERGWAWAGDHLGDALPAKGKLLHPWLTRLKAYFDAKEIPLAELFMPAPEPLSPEPVTAPPKPKAPPKPRKAAAPKAARAPKAETPKAARAPKTATPRAAKPTATQKAAQPVSEAALRARIVAAYDAVTGGGRGQRALLSDLRAQLPDIDRPTLDAALTRLHQHDPKMSLMPLNDPRGITSTIRDAALPFKGELLHLLWLDP